MNIVIRQETQNGPRSAYTLIKEAFMFLELEQGFLANFEGSITCPEEFGIH